MPEAPRLLEQRRVIEQHYELSQAIYGPQTFGRQMRKFGIKYSQLHPDSLAVRNAFIAVKRPEELPLVLARFYSEDLPGRHPAFEVDEAADCEA
jgi:hypothetical protein